MRARHVASLLFGCLWAVGCGASEPREQDIFHDPSLRAGSVEPGGEGERALLTQLASNPEPGPLEVGGQTFTLEATYAAASGHDCRAVRTDGSRRLACEMGEGWRFVPNVLGDR